MSYLFDTLRVKWNPSDFKAIGFFIYLFLIGINKTFAINVDDLRDDSFDIPSEFESIVYIKTGNVICTGTLINHRTILTAAHCFNDTSQAQIFIGNNIDESSSFIETTSFISYPENKRYTNFTGASYDLALISLKEPLIEINSI